MLFNLRTKQTKKIIIILIILSVVLVSYIYIIHSINSGIKEYSSLNVELIKTLQEREKTNNKINDDLLSLNNEVIVSQKQYKKNESNKKTLEDKYNSLVNAIESFKDDVKLIENDIQQKNLLSDKLKSEYDKRAISLLQSNIEMQKLQQNEDKLKQELLFLQEKYKQLGGTISSARVINTKLLSDRDIDMLKEWIIGYQDTKIELDLFYAGNYDFLNGDDFHKICDKMRNTLVIMKIKENGSLIGGFTTQNFSGGDFTTDKRAILFNLHLKSVYEIILPRDALFAMKGRLPSFGDGDLIISKPYCMSSFPYPYGMGKKRNELTEGLEKFVVEYMEVFEVTNHPLLNNK